VLTDQLAGDHDASAVVFTTTREPEPQRLAGGRSPRELTARSRPYTVSGTDADGFRHAGTGPTRSRHGQLITQAKPTSDTTTVDGSALHDATRRQGNNGTVSYTATAATRHTF